MQLRLRISVTLRVARIPVIFPCDLALADAVPLVTGLASCEAEGLPDAMRAASSRASGSGPFRGRCRTRMTSWRASFELAHLLCGSSAAARRTTRPRGGSERFLDTTRRRPTRISHGAPQRAPSTLQELSSRFPAAGQRSARRVASTTAGHAPRCTVERRVTGTARERQTWCDARSLRVTSMERAWTRATGMSRGRVARSSRQSDHGRVAAVVTLVCSVRSRVSRGGQR